MLTNKDIDFLILSVLHWKDYTEASLTDWVPKERRELKRLKLGRADEVLEKLRSLKQPHGGFTGERQ